MLHADIHTIAAIKCDESYDNIAAGFKDAFDDINFYIENSQITVNGVIYKLKFFLCADYKVSRKPD